MRSGIFEDPRIRFGSGPASPPDLGFAPSFTEDASERGTRLKIMGVDLPEDPKVSHEDLWDHLIAKKALIASALEKI